MPAELADALTATDDDRLEQAEALVRAHCGWHVAPSRTETVTLRGTGGSVLFLPSLYVTAIDSVTDDVTLLTDEDNYTWSTSGIITNLSYFSRSPVTVVMTHGYTVSPLEVTGVVQAIASRAVQNPGSLVRTQDGPFSDTYSQTGFNQSLPLALLEAEKDVLQAYRLPVLA